MNATGRRLRATTTTEAAVLALLALNGEQSGYDLLKHVTRSIGHIWAPAKSQLYALLPRLVQDGLVYRVPGRGTFVAASRANRRRMRSIAQNRLTAVGRVAAISAHMASNAAWSLGPSDVSRRTPRASPSAAVTPMAGAPRTAMSRMATAT